MHVSTQTSPPARRRTLPLVIVRIDQVGLSEWASGTVWASGPIPGATRPEIPAAGERASKPPRVRGGGKKGEISPGKQSGNQADSSAHYRSNL